MYIKCKCGNSIFDDRETFCPSCKIRLTSVIVQVGGVAMYIPSEQWKEREKYIELKKKWGWLDE